MSESGSVDLSDADGSLFSRSPSVEETPGEARWRASEPPEEVFGDGEWKFQIIGEEVDYQGNVQYEVEWDDWEREDGSNTTWESPESISDIKWRPVQQKIRNEAASKSLSMDVLTTTDIHMTDTYLRKQAFKEKLRRYTRQQKSTNSFDQMANLLMKHQEHVHPSGAVRIQASQSAQGSQGSSSSSFPLRTNQRASTRQQTEISLAGSSKSTLEGSSSRHSVTLTPGDLSSRSTCHSSPSHSIQTFAKSANQKPSQMVAHDYSPLVPRPTSTSTLKGKEKELACTPFTRTSNPLHHSTQIKHEELSSPFNLLPSTPSLQGKRKAIYTYSSHERVGSEQSTSSSSHKHNASSPLTVLSSTPRVRGKRKEGHTHSSRQRTDSEESESNLSPSKTPRKRLRRIVKSGSEDEDEDEGPRVSPFPSSKSRASSTTYLKKPMESATSNNVGHRRERVQRSWTALARNVNAAPIYLVNDIDDDELPDLGPSFNYLESTYKFSADVEKPSDDFLISCSRRRCNNASLCECQHPSDLIDESGARFFAYDSGLFTFNVPRGIEVIECNKLCGCSKEPHRCPNRVSQQPRKLPIEIFKTEKCGWGVRCTQPIKRGQVLGLYTGLVITREEADALPDHLARYRFDLDGDDDLGGEERQPEPDPTRRTYSVDSRLHGNWTRFINHSCSPNLRIYLAVHDTPPSIGLPYIVFVANRNIPIREEFSFDYNPVKSTSMVVDSEGEPCHCGSAICRGFY